MAVCKHCGAHIERDIPGVWLDDTDGDGCDPNVHEPVLKNFIVKERMACWVTWTYTVEAADDDDAEDRFLNGEHSGGVGVPDIGDSIDGYDTHIETTDAGETIE